MNVCPARPKLNKKFLFIKYSSHQKHCYRITSLHYRSLFWEVTESCPFCNASKTRFCSDEELISMGFKKIPEKDVLSWLGTFYNEKEIQKYL
jgi:late competence protein required for DNA uptake (superfamily II DNA/RNA helicase)